MVPREEFGVLQAEVNQLASGQENLTDQVLTVLKAVQKQAYLHEETKQSVMQN